MPKRTRKSTSIVQLFNNNRQNLTKFAKFAQAAIHNFSGHLVQAMAHLRHKTSGSAIQSTAQVSAQAQVTAKAQVPDQDQIQIRIQSPAQALGYVQG